MRCLAILLVIAMPSIREAKADDLIPQDSWVAIPGLTVSEIYFNQTGSPGLPETRGRYESHIVGTDALSWPDGRSALVTTIELLGVSEDRQWLYRCVEYKDENFGSTGETCWRLKQPSQ